MGVGVEQGSLVREPLQNSLAGLSQAPPAQSLGQGSRTALTQQAFKLTQCTGLEPHGVFLH